MDFFYLETERMRLKGLTPKDMTHIFTTMSKLDIMELLGHRNEEDFQKEAYKQQNGYAAHNRTFLMFLMVHKGTGKIIGRAGLHNWNVEHRRAEIGYDMRDDAFKRQGYMSEAVQAILEHGFGTLKLNRIEALVGESNVPSLRIIRKNGFVQEGHLRQHFLVDGQFVDSLLFSRLHSDEGSSIAG